MFTQGSLFPDLPRCEQASPQTSATEDPNLNKKI